MPGVLGRYAGPLAVLAGLLLVPTACASDPTADPDPVSGSRPPDSASPTPKASRSDDPSPSPVPGGTAAKPAKLTATRGILDWEPVPGPVSATVTTSGEWTLTVNEDATEATLEGPKGSGAVSTEPRERISDAFIDGEYAVVVKQDRQETRPALAVVLELDQLSGKVRTIDGSSDVPTTSGGTWALGQGHLVHATVHDGAYCTATVDLAGRTSKLGWCAPDHQGFNGARITPAGDSLLTFDDGRPACRTVVALAGDSVTPFTGVVDCKAWEGLQLEDGAVWSVIPNENQIENARLYARSGDDYFDLGPGTSGTLTWCAGAAYFVRDPQRDGDPATLLRWNVAQGLEVAYATAGGQGFLTTPRCGGDTLTLTALTASGDEQVRASLR